MRRALLLLNAVAFLGTSAWVLLDPARAATTLGFLALDGAGTQEFLANFVGLYGILGLVLLRGVWSRDPGHMRSSLWLLLLACGGLAAGRLCAWATGVEADSMQYGFLAWEALSAGGAWWFLSVGSTP